MLDGHCRQQMAIEAEVAATPAVRREAAGRIRTFKAVLP